LLELARSRKTEDADPNEKMIFTAEALEALEPIDEEAFEPNIGGIPIHTSPNVQEIREIIDLKRTSQDRRTFYLAKPVDGMYYWFHTPHIDNLKGSSGIIVADLKRESLTGEHMK
jgi:hypothetical protein